jgi:hypothetical protein
VSDPLDLDIPPLDGLRPARASDVRPPAATSPKPRVADPGRPAVPEVRQGPRSQAAAYGYNRLEFHGILIEDPEPLTSQKSGRQYCRGPHRPAPARPHGATGNADPHDARPQRACPPCATSAPRRSGGTGVRVLQSHVPPLAAPAPASRLAILLLQALRAAVPSRVPRPDALRAQALSRVVAPPADRRRRQGPLPLCALRRVGKRSRARTRRGPHLPTARVSERDRGVPEVRAGLTPGLPMCAVTHGANGYGAAISGLKRC